MAAPKNNKGYKSDKQWREAIQLAVHRLASDGKTKHLDLLAMRLVKAGADGDVSALREIGDRLDGKPAQSVSVGQDPDLGPVGLAVAACPPLTREEWIKLYAGGG